MEQTDIRVYVCVVPQTSFYIGIAVITQKIDVS